MGYYSPESREKANSVANSYPALTFAPQMSVYRATSSDRFDKLRSASLRARGCHSRQQMRTSARGLLRAAPSGTLDLGVWFRICFLIATGFLQKLSLTSHWLWQAHNRKWPSQRRGRGRACWRPLCGHSKTVLLRQLRRVVTLARQRDNFGGVAVRRCG